MSWKGRDVINILDFSREDLDLLFQLANRFADEDYRGNDLENRMAALLFLEPSTRTMYSFMSAVYRLGGKPITLSKTEASSIAKGETFGDTIRMFDSYSDIIIVRDRREGAAKYAADLADSPVINGGDGAHNHPTQAMIDLFTITRYRGGVDGLKVGVLGDLKYGRAAASFILGLTIYDPDTIYLISPESLKLKKEVKDYLDSVGVRYFETEDLMEVISELDVLYVTRIQKERFPDPLEYERVRGSYKIDLSTLSNAKDDLMVMHPLPRVDEISTDVDNSKYQYYFKQARNGVYLRMALLKLILGD